MASWYIAYKNGAASVMHVFAGRDAAVDAACELLRRGREVTEVAPMEGELPEGERLGPAELRRLSRRRAAAGEPAAT